MAALSSSMNRARSMILIAAAQAVVVSVSCGATALPSFSGADGAGGTVTGGAGGSVYHVTILDTKVGDLRPGTLQYGLQNATGPTTIVFDVGGTIWLGRLTTDTEGWDTTNVLNIPANVTIAGQTAPGGITIMGGQIKVTGNRSVNPTAPVANSIIQDVTLAAGYGTRKANSKSGYYDNYTYDNMDIDASGVMVDHVSALFSTDESISANELANNVTVQYTTIAQGQSYPEADAEGNGDYEAHALGDLWGVGSNAVTTFSHNLYVNTAGRIPAIQTETSALQKDANGNYIPGYTDFRNNVIYNWFGYAGYGDAGEPSAGEFEGNYYKVGPGGDAATGNNTDYSIVYQAGGATAFKGSSSTDVYQTGNVLLNLNGSAVNLTNAGYGSATFEPASFFTNIPYNGTTDTAQNAYTQVLNYSGANWQNRDLIDQRLVYEAETGTGKIAALDSPNAGFIDNAANPALDVYSATNGVGDEWNTLLGLRSTTNGGTGGTGSLVRPANYDTDADGMPDVWEAAMGTSPTVADNNGNIENNGYTNLQNYLNELGAWPASTPLIFGNANGTGRYAEIGNWQTGIFEPSRYDTAEINSGAATVDVPGQHANLLAIATNGGNVATLAVTNGWIDVDQQLMVGPGGAGTVNQSGGIVHAGVEVVLGGSNNAGNYNLSGGTLATPLLTKGTKGGTFNFTGGTLHANTVGFDLTNNGGTLAPGSDLNLQLIAAASMPDINDNVETIQSFVGNTHIMGNLTLNTGSLQIDLASLTSFDTVTVDKLLTLGGSLNVVLDNGYTPGPSTEWQIGTASSIASSFTSITPGYYTQVTGGNLYLITVPEPASLALLSLTPLTLISRRKRHPR